MAIIDKIQLSGTVYTIGNETTTAVTSASTDNEIPTAKAVYDAIPQGGGSTYTGVSGITINENNEIYYKNFVKTWLSKNHDDRYAVYWLQGADAKIWINGNSPEGRMSYLRSQFSFGLNQLNMSSDGFALGSNNNINGLNAGGLCNGNTVNGNYSLGVNYQNKTNNSSEFASGQFNKSVSTSTTFGNSGNTLFSVGNGTAENARHNAFEIRQNGDIYLTKDGQDVKLQDQLGGGGSSYTAGDGIDITNDVISVTGKVDTTTYNTYTAATDTALASKADTSAVTEIQDSLSGYVYTADNGKQDIYGSKTFIGNKKISFTQAGSNDKLGFTLYDARDEQGNAKEFGAFELNPTGITENGVTHPLLTLNHYRGNNGRNVQTYIGYRQYDYLNSAAYHLLAPLPENAKTPFSLTTSYKNFYMPLGIKVDNSTMVKADSGGVMDISSYIGGGGSITIDPSLDSGSTNAVSNSAVSAALNYNNMFLYRVDPKRTWDNHPTGVLQLRWRNPYNGSTATTQDAITLVKINNIPLIADSVSGIYNLNLVESSAVTSAITSGSTDAQVPSAKAVNDKLGGLSLVKLTQSEYDNLSTRDSNTLYIING